MPGWVVHKFGGTSVLNAERYVGVSKIIEGLGSGARRGIVVSAMKGVTDGLIEAVDLARKRDASYTGKLEALKRRHLEAIDGMLKGATVAPLKAVLEKD